MPDKVKISELETTTSVTGSTYLAVDDGTTTKKITVDNYNSSANTTARGYALQSAASATEAAGQATAAANTAAEVTLSVNRAVELAGQAANSASAAAGSAANAHSDAAAASASASQASQKAAAAQDSAAQIDAAATLARSWAVGGTNSRAGEDANNAKYWAERASNAAGGGVQSFNSRSGYVNPQSGDYSASMVSYSNGSSGLSANNAQAAIDEVNTKANGKAATKHDSTGTSYGVGTSSKYGHVKLSDSYTSSDGAAANSVGASSKAVNDAYTALHNITDGLGSDISTVNGRVTSVNSTLSASITSVSNTSAGHYNELKGELTANGNRIYMDYQNGKYGINTDPSRGAGTFVPFKGYQYLGTATSYDLSDTTKDYYQPNWEQLTSANFVVRISSIYQYLKTWNWSGEENRYEGGSMITIPSASYNATTGVLTISNTSVAGPTPSSNLNKNDFSYGIQVYLFY